MFDSFFKKKEYIDCPFMKHSIHFFYDEVRACCSNVPGPIFYQNKWNSQSIDWQNIKKERIKVIKKASYDKCKGCYSINNFITSQRSNNIENVIDRVYIQNYMSCNAKCTYCTFSWVNRGYRYKVVPIIKSIIEDSSLSPNAYIYMSGGEITISPEFEDLLYLLLNYLNRKIEIYTSGIKYCKSIEEAFKQDKCSLMISPDAGTRETYKKIKQVDCFDRVIENIQNYIKATDNAKKSITLKYIIVDDVNDNIDEIEKFLTVVSTLGVENVRIDIDYEKYRFIKNIKVPSLYFKLIDSFNKTAKERNLNIMPSSQTEAILNKSR